MQSDAFQVLLNRKNCSGRGVRLKAVGPNAVQAAQIDTGKLVDEKATNAEYGALLHRELLKRSLVAVTEQSGLTTQDELLKVPPAGWKSHTIGEYEVGKLDELFTARDYTILIAIVRQIYDASQEDVDSIMGGALPVSEG